MAHSDRVDRPTLVSRSFLQDLAGELTAEWLDLGRYLNISDAKLHEIKTENTGQREAKYQMLRSWKQTRGEDATHTVLAAALLKVKRKDLWDKVWVDKNEAKTLPQEDVLSPERSLGLPNKEKKAQFLKELRKKYKNLCGGIQPVPFLRDKYDVDKLFVENGIEYLFEQQGGRADREKWKALENYKTVFNDANIKSNRRIIQGEPGFGKSILALQITQDWCHEKPPMNNVEILILLRLRQFKNVPSVFSAIRKFILPKDSKLTERDIECILDCSSTVILFDGYDEYPDRWKEETHIGLIIMDDMLQEHEVIVTTRTSCLPPDYSRDTERFRLTGFDDNAKSTYIQNIVTGGNSDDAEKIKQFLKENPAPADLCNIPLFFAMITYMVHVEEKFLNLKTVTDFFRHMVKCFSTHQQIKETRNPKDKGLDHSALYSVTYEGLSGTVQQISWGKNELSHKIGEEVYNEYVRIGILIEEEGYDYDSMEYKTETRFFHKMFVEWFAAHYLAYEAGRQGTEFEPWVKKSFQQPRPANLSQCQACWANEDVHLLKSLDPNDVHYMYRYACGLNNDAALKIIDHLTKEGKYDQYTLMCITEWGGDLQEIPKTVVSICSRGIRLNGNDSLLLQKSVADLITFASNRKIQISKVSVYNCLDAGFLPTGNLRVKPFALSLPVMVTLRNIAFEEHGLEITDEQMEGLLGYAAECLRLKKLEFHFCLLPQYINVTKSLPVLKSRNVKIEWIPEAMQNFIYAMRGWPQISYLLNLESGKWEYNGHQVSDVEYHRQVQNVRLLAEEAKKTPKCINGNNDVG